LRAEHAELAATIERVVQASLPRQRQMAIERDAMEARSAYAPAAPEKRARLEERAKRATRNWKMGAERALPASSPVSRRSLRSLLETRN